MCYYNGFVRWESENLSVQPNSDADQYFREADSQHRDPNIGRIALLS